MTAPPDDLALPRLKAFVQRRGGTYWHSPRHGAHSALFGRNLTQAETDELRRLADAARVENLAVIGPVTECGA